MGNDKVPKHLDKIFEDFLSRHKIFSDRDVMRASYVPEDLPHRENQQTQITHILSPVLIGDVPSNIFLYGKTGTGKTAVALNVLKYIKAKCNEIKADLPIIEIINCKDYTTDYSVYHRLALAVGVPPKDAPFTGLRTDDLFERFKNKLDTRRQIIMIVLDEIDQLVKKTTTKGSQDVLYKLTRIDLEQARICIVGISNDLKFKDYLDPRVLSSLRREEMVFPPYQADELQDILKRRAEMGFLEGVIDTGTIEITAALAAREHGDARRAIDLLRVAGELAERESAERVTEMHVRRAETYIERDTISDALRTLPIQSKLTLYSIYLLEKNKAPEIYTGDVYTAYSQLCKATNNTVLTQRRVSDLINELDMLGIITAQVISKGRYGRSKKISLSIPKSVLTSILEEDYKIKKVKDFPIELKREENQTL